jgi:hypothetical protein
MAFSTHVSQGYLQCYHDGALVHTRACKGLTNNRDRVELLYNHTEALSELNKEMRDPSQACTADNTLAVACLAYNGLDVAAVEPAKSPSQAPFNVSANDGSHGALNTAVMHAEGLAKLVAMPGGMSKLEIEGLAAIIS